MSISKDKAREMFKDGCTKDYIQQHLNLSKTTVSRYLQGLRQSNKDIVNKGVAKVNKGLKVYETKVHDLSALRCVEIGDNKKTKIYVKNTDCRTDEVIRNQFLSIR